MNERQSVEIHSWLQEGYKPLVFSNDWQVALLNWEPIFDLKNLSEIEMHCESDEVFVLLKGKAVLFTINSENFLRVDEMEQGKIYNVTKCSWHNLIASNDAKWAIVENRNTHISDTEYRDLTHTERSKLLEKIPRWLTCEQEE